MSTEHVERKGKYTLVPPAGAHDWWQINDMELMYAVVSVQASFPDAEKSVRFAWSFL
jgi:hypothetical protein